MVISTDPIRIPLTFFRGNSYSSEKCDMFSNPMNAHGDITAMRMIWANALEPSTYMGSYDNELSWRNMAMTAQTVNPRAKTRAETTIMRFGMRELLEHRRPTRTMADMESSASPSQTS